MKKFSSKVIIAIAALCFAPLAQATIISSIDMTVRSSTYTVTDEDSISSIQSAFASGSMICETSLSALSNAGSVQTCGGPNRDIATLFQLEVTQAAPTLWQFGGDWGRGGAIFGTSGFVRTGDIWWNRDWNDSDVITFRTTGTSGTLNLLGFENCCAGGMSLRYSTDHGRTWNIAAVNVPAPGALALLGFGLLGLGLARRRA